MVPQYSTTDASPTAPRHVLRRLVRAGLVAKGKSLAQWCREHGVKDQNAHRALTGKWTGPAAEKLIEHLKRAAGL